MNRSNKVFLDSSGFLALTNRNDVSHKQAQDIWNRIIEEGWRTYTTNFVIAETQVLRVNTQDEQKAEDIIFKYVDKTFSYADATSFAVMERLKIKYAFTFDRNFTQYGLMQLNA